MNEKIMSLKRWLWVLATSAILSAFLCGISSVALLALYRSEQTAQTVENWKKSPFLGTHLVSIAVNNGAPFPPTSSALITHPCDRLRLVRTADVSEDMVVVVGRSIQSPTFSMQLLAGAEQFKAKKNPNVMRPLFQVPSNVPRYKLLNYDVLLQDITRPSPAEPTATVAFYVIDGNQPLPKPGGRIPSGPGPNDPIGPQCPASSISPSLPPIHP
jgi:hypothetical protein